MSTRTGKRRAAFSEFAEPGNVNRRAPADLFLRIEAGAMGPPLTELQDQFEIEAHPQYASGARERVLALAVLAGFSSADLGDIEIAVGEAVTNAILYGSPSVESRVAIRGGLTGYVFHVEIRDQGRGFDPSLLRPDEDTDALGGRGVGLMRVLMDEVDLHHDGQGMIARLIKRLPRSPGLSDSP